MADMERFYREARNLASSAICLADEARQNKPITDRFCSKYEALTQVLEPRLLKQMRDAGEDPDASPEIRDCLQHVDSLRQLMGPGFDDVVRRVVHG